MIARAEARDVDLIMPVMAAAFDPAYGEAWTAPQCAGILSLPGSLFLIARSGDVISGFALARYVLDEAELLLLAVLPQTQRTGVGAALLDQVIESILQVKVRRMHLEVRADNPALRFYTRLGFMQVGKRRDYYTGLLGKRTDAVTLSRLFD